MHSTWFYVCKKKLWSWDQNCGFREHETVRDFGGSGVKGPMALSNMGTGRFQCAHDLTSTSMVLDTKVRVAGTKTVDFYKGQTHRHTLRETA